MSQLESSWDPRVQRGMPEAEHEWNPRPRTYASEVVLAAAVPVAEHPLQPKEKAEPKPTGAAPLPEAPMDPLSLMMAAAEVDPLGANDPRFLARSNLFYTVRLDSQGVSTSPPADCA